MYTEVESSDIITFLLNQYQEKEMLKIPYHDIFEYANALEKRNEDVITFCDMMSIDAFRCELRPHVIMESNYLVINDISSIRNRVNRLLPRPEVMEKLTMIFENNNEKNS